MGFFIVSRQWIELLMIVFVFLGLECGNCVIQWRYIAGNNWGMCPDGTGAVGCGPQEEFRACSDISIGINSFELHSIDNQYDRSCIYPHILVHLFLFFR